MISVSWEAGMVSGGAKKRDTRRFSQHFYHGSGPCSISKKTGYYPVLIAFLPRIRSMEPVGAGFQVAYVVVLIQARWKTPLLLKRRGRIVPPYAIRVAAGPAI